MDVRGGLATLFFAGVVAWSGRAEAQYFDVAPTIHATAGYTLARIVSDSRAPTDESGPMVTLTPSIALSYDTPRITQKLTVGGTGSLRLATSDGTFVPAYSLRLTYAGGLPLDERNTLTLHGGVTATPVNPFNTLQDASQTSLEAPPADSSYNLSLTATESLQHDLSPDAGLTQTTGLLYNFPVGADRVRASTLSVTNSLALTRHFTVDTLGLTGTVVVTRFGPSETDEGPTDPRTQVLNTLVATWRRNITEALAGSIHGGVSATVSPTSTTQLTWAPTGGAQLTYAFDPALVSLDYTYAAAVNIYTASTNLNNTVSLRGSLPFGTTGIALSTTAGYLRSVPIGDTPLVVDTTLGAGFNTYTADAALTYTPVPIPVLTFSLRGLIARQVPFSDPNLATTRESLIANVAFSYPNALQAAEQRRATPTMQGEAFRDMGTGQDFVVPEVAAPGDAPAPTDEPDAQAP